MFDLNILPMNLVNGRNLGELPGLRIFTAPKRCDRSRLNDVLIMVITVEEKAGKASDFNDWGTLISDAYFNARGSFTMGITAAVKQFSSFLNEKYPGVSLPNVLLNLCVLRDRTLLIGHAGPVNTTVVYADHVDNFSDLTSTGVSHGTQGLRFFQIEIHSGDLILMCPQVPHGWTNEAILDATGESPLNVIRYLLDQAHGNLQGVVIQVKAGRGEILYRYKPPITATVSLGYREEDEAPEFAAREPAVQSTDYSSGTFKTSGGDFLLGSDDEKARPLFRTRLPLEAFPVAFNPLRNVPETVGAASLDQGTEEAIPEDVSDRNPESQAQPDSDIPPFLSAYSSDSDGDLQPIEIPIFEETYAGSEMLMPSEQKKKSDEDAPITEGDQEQSPESFEPDILPEQADSELTEPEGESDQLNQEFSEFLTEEQPADAAPADQVSAPPPSADEKRSRIKEKKRKAERKRSRKPFAWKRFLLGVFFGLVVPIIVVSVLFVVYTSRSKDSAYRDRLSSAVETAKVAVQQSEPSLQRISWQKVIEYLDEAALFGSSNASRELRKQALESLDKLDYGRLVPYHYALSGTLPAGTSLTRIESTSQFMFALDQTSGSVYRFNIYSDGFTRDSAFSCGPGDYRRDQGTDSSDKVSVGKLVDFIVLPQESGRDRLVMGIDNQARLLYCPSLGEKTAAELEAPALGWLGVDALYFTDRMLFVLDARNNAVWRMPYLGSKGIALTPESYFGSNSPGLRDVTDFVVHEANSYFLRSNGTLITCDYTGYIPLCSYVDQLKSSDGTQQIDLSAKNYFQLNMNVAPDTSLYLMDSETQSVLNFTLKMNLIKNSVPDRFDGEGSERKVSGFGFLDQFQMIWASGGQLYIGALK